MARGLGPSRPENGELFPDLPKPPERSSRYVKPCGHAAPPGSGPKGEACGGCAHAKRIRIGKKRFAKCGLGRANWTHSRRTDIRLRDAACAYWERCPEDING